MAAILFWININVDTGQTTVDTEQQLNLGFRLPCLASY
ncbi:hypothetical protein GARC_0324 [Paraglaciecola arctica BSs20135]|uniref:Uncharacterized protein n=1 Tax=Paraglaciecola arctica BSs20135 TaxID=493475 RepID=K6Y0B5_9ALTE|nr:hypothetical protein GARC_0324 [Paraglaciecola arctica BSs20135]